MPAFRRVSPIVSKPSFHEMVAKPINQHSVEVHENTPAFMRLDGYDNHHDLGCTMELALANTPNFLLKHIESPLEHILLCSKLTMHKPSHPHFKEETLDLVLSLKLLLQGFEHLYLYSAQKATSGVLFVVNEDQLSLISSFEDLISYAEYCPMDEENKTLFFIPTDVASYDLFLEFKEEFSKHLDQLLWSKQSTSSLIRHYLKSTSICS